MRIYLIYLSIICLFICSCASSNDNVHYATEGKENRLEIFGNEVPMSRVRSNSVIDVQYLQHWFKTEYVSEKINVNISEANISDSNFRVYSIALGDEIPNNLKKYYTIVHSVRQQGIYLLPIEFTKFFSIENYKMFGGVYNNREFDFYVCYILDSAKLKINLDSRALGKFGLKIGYYRDDDCVEYIPNRFDISYQENPEKIIFSGKILHYCKDKEDRNDTIVRPIFTDTARVEFDFYDNKWNYNLRSSYTFW